MPLDTSHIFNQADTPPQLTGTFSFSGAYALQHVPFFWIFSAITVFCCRTFLNIQEFFCVLALLPIIYRLSPGAAIGSRPDKWLLLAALFVLFSDYYLLFTDSYLKGVLIFCIVQCFYALYLTPAKLAAFITGSALISAAAVLLIHHFFHTGGILLYTSLLYIFMLHEKYLAGIEKSKENIGQTGASLCFWVNPLFFM